MRPPECDICGKEENCNLVYFKKRLSDKEWDNKMEEKGMVGHPPYAEWYCDVHVGRARELKEKTIDEARKLMKS
ncbi:MAG: hypothetical protein ACFFCS_27000 [Candidatus Hodarchaeota archaeon]